MDPAAYRQFAGLDRTHWWFRGRRAVFAALLRAFLEPGTERRILDLGCGYGGMFSVVAPFGRVVGIDLSLDGLAAARERGVRALAAADATALPFADGTFDLVCMFDTLEHCDDDLGVSRECARTLRPGGIAFVSGPAYPFLYAQNDRVAHHRRRYTRGGLRRLLERAGLETVKGTYVNALLFPAILPTVLYLKARERLFGPNGKTNLSYEVPGPVNEALAAVFSAEGRIVPRVSFPAGHSLAIVARKPGGGTRAR